MTCIVGIAHENKVHLAGDGQDTGGDLSKYVSEPKVWISNGFVLGHSGHSQACQLSKHVFVPSTPSRGESLMTYMVSRFIPELRKELTSNGLDLAATNEDDEPVVDISLLVGVRGSLFEVNGWCVYECADFAAIGCGAAWAVGSLRETRKLTPRYRLQRALASATAHSAGVGPPYTFVNV